MCKNCYTYSIGIKKNYVLDSADESEYLRLAGL